MTQAAILFYLFSLFVYLFNHFVAVSSLKSEDRTVVVHCWKKYTDSFFVRKSVKFLSVWSEMKGNV